MDDYKLYEIKLEENRKRNKKYLKEFEGWLKEKNLAKKTITKHLNNIDFYINDYLNYYEITKMEEGIHEAYMFLNDWFIRKCLYSTVTSIKENAASIKKFYQCMNEKKHISNEDYEFLYRSISDNMDEFISSLLEYDEYDGEEWEEFI